MSIAKLNGSASLPIAYTRRNSAFELDGRTLIQNTVINKIQTLLIKDGCLLAMIEGGRVASVRVGGKPLPSLNNQPQVDAFLDHFYLVISQDCSGYCLNVNVKLKGGGNVPPKAATSNQRRWEGDLVLNGLGSDYECWCPNLGIEKLKENVCKHKQNYGHLNHLIIDGIVHLEKGDFRIKMTPLCHATIQGYVEMVELLLQEGADPSIYVPGYPDLSPIFIAIGKNKPEIISLLLEHGANLTVRTAKKNMTPLELAIRANRVNIVALLLGHGANPKDKGVQREAKKSKNPEIVKLLKRAITEGPQSLLPKKKEETEKNKEVEKSQPAEKESGQRDELMEVIKTKSDSEACLYLRKEKDFHVEEEHLLETIQLGKTKTFKTCLSKWHSPDPDEYYALLHLSSLKENFEITETLIELNILLPHNFVLFSLNLLFRNDRGLKYTKDWKDLAFSLIDTIVNAQQEETLVPSVAQQEWSPQLFAYACTKGYVRLASRLLDCGFKGSFADLEKAVAGQQVGLVALFLEKLISIETLQGQEGAKLLLKASQTGNLDIVKQLAQAGANPCSEGSELYLSAAQNGWNDMIEWLYQSGAQIERGNPLGVLLRTAHEKGGEPNQNSIVRLLNRGSNVAYVPDFLRKKYAENLSQACCSEESGFVQQIIDPLINRIMRVSDHLSEKIEVTGKGRELKGIILQALMQSDLIYRTAAGDHNAILITEEICRSLRSKLSELLELSFYFNVKTNNVNSEELVSELKNSLRVIEARYKVEEEKAASEKEHLDRQKEFYRKELALKEQEIEEARRKRETNERLQREEMERKANEHRENLAKQEEIAEKERSYLAYIDQENARRAEEQAELARRQLAATQVVAQAASSANNIVNNYRW